MDGYHLPRSQLDAEGLRRRGAPYTFDASAFRADIARLRQSHSGFFPAFDHAEKDPRPDAIHITTATPMVIVEGNYVLMRDWRLEELFDLRVFLDCDLETAIERLVKRHVASGICATPEEARDRAMNSDRVNALLILADGCRERADLVVERIIPSDQWRPITDRCASKLTLSPRSGISTSVNPTVRSPSASAEARSISPCTNRTFSVVPSNGAKLRNRPPWSAWLDSPLSTTTSALSENMRPQNTQWLRLAAPTSRCPRVSGQLIADDQNGVFRVFDTVFQMVQDPTGLAHAARRDDDARPGVLVQSNAFLNALHIANAFLAKQFGIGFQQSQRVLVKALRMGLEHFGGSHRHGTVDIDRQPGQFPSLHKLM